MNLTKEQIIEKINPLITDKKNFLIKWKENDEFDIVIGNYDANDNFYPEAFCTNKCVKKLGFLDKCNTCRTCDFNESTECSATEEYRKENGCDMLYQIDKEMNEYLNDPKETEERERLARQMSHLSVEDMFRPFTI